MENTKEYIGKGTEKSAGTMFVSIKMSAADAHITEYNGEKYLNFYVSKMRNPDNYGKTHTAYTFVPEVNQPTEDSTATFDKHLMTVEEKESLAKPLPGESGSLSNEDGDIPVIPQAPAKARRLKKVVKEDAPF